LAATCGAILESRQLLPGKHQGLMAK